MALSGPVDLGEQKFTSSSRLCLARLDRKSNHVLSVSAMNGCGTSQDPPGRVQPSAR
jgi:hypothetical protein